MIIILSVEHTGTNFLMSFLDYQGMGYKQLHTNEDCALYEGNLALVPLRDPLVQFMSWRKRYPHNTFDYVLNYCDEQWARLGKLVSQFNCDFLRLETGMFENDANIRNQVRQAELMKIARHISAPRDVAGFGWPVVNAYNKRPTQAVEFNSVSKPEQKLIMDVMLPHRKKWGYA